MNLSGQIDLKPTQSLKKLEVSSLAFSEGKTLEGLVMTVIVSIRHVFL